MNCRLCKKKWLLLLLLVFFLLFTKCTAFPDLVRVKEAESEEDYLKKGGDGVGDPSCPIRAWMECKGDCYQDRAWGLD